MPNNDNDNNDIYCTSPNIKAERIRIGDKSLRIIEVNERTKDIGCRIREPKLIFCLVNSQTGSQSHFRKGVHCGAGPARRDVPHIEKCSPIRSTNLRYSSCYDDDRSRPIEKIVKIWLQSADFSSRFSRVGRRPRKMVKYLDLQMFFGPRFSSPGLTGPNKAKIPLDFSSFGTHSLDRTSVRNWTHGDDW